MRYLRRDGSTLWVEMVTRPLVGEDGAVQGLGGTLTDVSARRRTEEAMARRERYLSALVEMQQRLLMAQQEGDLYQDVLGPIGQAAGASRIYFFEVFRGEAGQRLMSQRAEWCAPGVKPVSGNPRHQPVQVDRDFKRWGELLSRGEVVSGRVKDFPVTERAILEPQGIRSMLVLPLRINNTWVGFIGLDHCEAEQDWDKLEVDLLSAAAGALSLELEHRQSESALRERETRYRQLAENASDVQYRYKLEPPRAFLYVSRVVVDRLGYTPEEHYANPELWRQLVHPGDLPALGQLLETPHQLGSKPVVLRFTSRNGRTRWLEHTVAPVLDTSGRPVVVEGIARDITERREVEEQLKLSEASFRILLEGVADAAAIQRDGRIVYANMALVSALGFDRPDQLVGRALAQFIEDDMEEVPGPPPDPSGIKGMITGERRLVRRDGKTRVAELVSLPLLFDGAPAVVSIARDVTDQRQFQARLTLADRLASVGTLAAGIAHEINNPLAFVISNLSFLSEEMRRSQLALETSGTGGVHAPALARLRSISGGPDLVEWQEVLSEAYEGAERVRQIVRLLKTFSRPDEERADAGGRAPGAGLGGDDGHQRDPPPRAAAQGLRGGALGHGERGPAVPGVPQPRGERRARHPRGPGAPERHPAHHPAAGSGPRAHRGAGHGQGHRPASTSRASSIRSSPPSRWTWARGWACPSATASSPAWAGRSPSRASWARAPPSGWCCRRWSLARGCGPRASRR